MDSKLGEMPSYSQTNIYNNSKPEMGRDFLESLNVITQLQSVLQNRNPMGGIMSALSTPTTINGHQYVTGAQNFAGTGFTKPSPFLQGQFADNPEKLKRLSPPDSAVQQMQGQQLYDMAKRVDRTVQGSYSLYTTQERDPIVNLYRVQQQDLRKTSIFNMLI